MANYKKIFLFCTAFCLVACSSLSQLNVPNSFQYQGKNYQLVASQDLGNIARYLYLPPQDSLDNWQSEIELLFDRNWQNQSIAQRIALRQRVYHNTGVQYFNLIEQGNELISSVIYPPTLQNPSWQLNVARGLNIDDCGFVQFQLAHKIDLKALQLTHLNEQQITAYLQQDIAKKAIQQLQKINGQWQCN